MSNAITSNYQYQPSLCNNIYHSVKGIIGCTLKIVSLGGIPYYFPNIKDNWISDGVLGTKFLLAQPYKSFVQLCSIKLSEDKLPLLSLKVFERYKKINSNIFASAANTYEIEIKLKIIYPITSLAYAISGIVDVALGMICATFGLLGSPFCCCINTRAIHNLAYRELQGVGYLFLSLNELSDFFDVTPFF